MSGGILDSWQRSDSDDNKNEINCIIFLSINMDISLTPDTYVPSVDDNGNYIDNIPTIRNGLICPCGSRKDKVYENNMKFAIHIKSKKHQKWILQLNQNKANYYVECIKSKELIENQKKIIAQLEQQLHNKLLTIDYLTKQLYVPETVDLLDIN